MSIQNLYPNIEPTLNLSFALTKALDPRITFSRASSGAVYDGKTVAKAEENLLANSNSFSNSTYWLLDATTVASATDPAGGSTASRMTATATNAVHAIGGTNTGANQVAYAAGVTLTFSILAKKSTHDFIQITQAGVVGAHANFDIATGTVGSVVGTGLSPSASMTEFPAGSGWYRCVLTFTPSAALTAGSLSVSLVASNTASRREAFSAAGTEAVDIFGAQIEARSTVTAYTPTTTQPITNYIPVLQTAAAGVARFDHNPITGESLGLLIEEQRTNLLERSQEFDNAYWSKGGSSSASANVVVAPDGTLTAEKFVEGSATAFPEIERVVSTLSGQHTWSVFAKKGERQWLAVDAFVDSARRTWFNLDNGTVGTSAAGNTATITPVGNGWYRCTVSRDATGAVRFRLFMSTSDNGGSYTGNGYSGIYIWGAQLEAGAFPTSYIPTVASQVTRSGDAASMTGANFSSWYRADEGSFYIDGNIQTTGINNYLIARDNATASNRLHLYIQNNTAFFQIRSGGSTEALITRVPSNKNAAGYELNNSAFVVNGQLATDTVCVMPSALAEMIIGSNGNIKKLAFYPKRLADAELQALTQN
jgi:hypothetical protein